MGFSFKPVQWFACRLCRHVCSNTEELNQHKLENHLGDCMKIKCIIFEERLLDREWAPPPVDPNGRFRLIANTVPNSKMTYFPTYLKPNPFVSLIPLTPQQLRSVNTSQTNLKSSDAKDESRRRSRRERKPYHRLQDRSAASAQREALQLQDTGVLTKTAKDFKKDRNSVIPGPSSKLSSKNGSTKDVFIGTAMFSSSSPTTVVSVHLVRLTPEELDAASSANKSSKKCTKNIFGGGSQTSTFRKVNHRSKAFGETKKIAKTEKLRKNQTLRPRHNIKQTQGQNKRQVIPRKPNTALGRYNTSCAIKYVPFKQPGNPSSITNPKATAPGHSQKVQNLKDVTKDSSVESQSKITEKLPNEKAKENEPSVSVVSGAVTVNSPPAGLDKPKFEPTLISPSTTSFAQEFDAELLQQQLDPSTYAVICNVEEIQDDPATSTFTQELQIENTYTVNPSETKEGADSADNQMNDTDNNTSYLILPEDQVFFMPNDFAFEEVIDIESSPEVYDVDDDSEDVEGQILTEDFSFVESTR